MDNNILNQLLDNYADELKNNKFEPIYDGFFLGKILPPGCDCPNARVSYLTNMLREANIDPLDYLNDMPNGMYYKDQTIEYVNDIPDNIKKMGISIFFGCGNLKSAILPDSIESMEGYCFSNCRQLESVTLPKTLKRLCLDTFKFCTNLKEIKNCQQLNIIGHSAFLGCKKLTSLDLSYATEISGKALSQCTNLTDLKLSNYLEFIEYNALEQHNPNLLITFYGHQNEWERLIENKSSLQKIKVKYLF